MEAFYSIVWLINIKDNNNQYCVDKAFEECSKRQYYWMRNKEQHIHSLFWSCRSRIGLLLSPLDVHYPGPSLLKAASWLNLGWPGWRVISSIPLSNTDPLSYINLANTPPNLEFHNIGPSQIIDIIKQFDNKTSPDLDGLSTALLKKVSIQISFPLAHIFNLSIQQGIFPTKLNVTWTVLIFKAGDLLLCDN